MFLNKITLLNFKNHSSLSLNFAKKINCFIGRNGAGKTNIIDSIYYLCLTKSYFNSVDQQNILFGKDFFRLDGRFTRHAGAGSGNPDASEDMNGQFSDSPRSRNSDQAERAWLDGQFMNPVPQSGELVETRGVAESPANYREPEKNGSFQKFQVVYKLPLNKRKELIVNDTPVPKLSDHIGNFPCIIICPDDNQLILGSSEERRKFLDATLSQVNHKYLEWLLVYNKVLAQRNAALKQFAENKRADRHLLESYNRQLSPLGTNIHKARKELAGKLAPVFQSYYKRISLERELVSFTYYSQLNDMPMEELLHQNLDRDIMLQRTDAGIHKDDMEFFIAPASSRSYVQSEAPRDGDAAGEHNDGFTSAGRNSRMKKFGSQGQQKSFIIAIKFAQYEMIKQNTRFKPLLLIDDIFDKLDNDRSQKLIELIATDEFGQIFLTDTGDAHIRETLKNREELFEVIEIEAYKE